MLPAFIMFLMFYIIAGVVIRMAQTYTSGTGFGAALAYIH
jgi:hypothetical protein